MIKFCTLIFLLLVGVTIESVAAEKTYVIGYSEGSPFHLQAVERVRLVYTRAGLKVEFRALPHQRTLVLANKGEIDGDVARIPSIVNKYQNLRKVDAKLIAIRGVAYTSLKEITSYNDALLDSHVIGRVRGIYWSESKLDTYSSVGVNSYPQMFKMLVNKRLDIALATEASGDDVVYDMGENASGIIKLEPPIFSTDLQHYVHKKNVSIIPKLEAAIKSIRREGLWSK